MTDASREVGRTTCAREDQRPFSPRFPLHLVSIMGRDVELVENLHAELPNGSLSYYDLTRLFFSRVRCDHVKYRESYNVLDMRVIVFQRLWSPYIDLPGPNWDSFEEGELQM